MRDVIYRHQLVHDKYVYRYWLRTTNRAEPELAVAPELAFSSNEKVFSRSTACTARYVSVPVCVCECVCVFVYC